MKHLKNTYAIYLLLAIVAVYLFSMHNRISGMDEAILAEQAYWFAKEGFVKSKLFAGMGQGWEFIQLHYHKLFIWIGAGAIKLFGFSWYLFKFLTLIFFLGFLFFFRKYLQREGLHEYIWLAFSLIIINYFVFLFSFFFRPEASVMLFGFLSYYSLVKGLEKKPSYIVLAGLSGAASALLHLNGLIFLAAGGIVLLAKKEYKLTVIFSIAGFAGLFFYFIEVLTPDKWQLYMDQLFNDPNVKEDSLGPFSPLLKIFSEHKRIFRGPKEILMTALPVIALFFNFKYLRKNYSILIIYTLVLIVSLSIIAHGISSKYMMLYLPFFLLIFLHSFENPVRKNYYDKVGFALVFLYVIAHSIFVFQTFKGNKDISQRSEYFGSLMKKKEAKVLSTDSFIFNQLTEHDINGILGYRYKIFNYEQRKPEEVPASDFFEFAKLHEREYIVIDAFHTDKRVLNIIDFSNLKQGNNYFGYILIEKREDYAIFEFKD